MSSKEVKRKKGNQYRLEIDEEPVDSVEEEASDG